MFFTSPPCRRPVNALHKTLYIVVINVHLLNADACSAKPRMTNHWSFLVVVVVIIVRPNLMGPEWVAVSSIYPLAHKGLRVTQKHCNWIGITGEGRSYYYARTICFIIFLIILFHRQWVSHCAGMRHIHRSVPPLQNWCTDAMDILYT